MKAVVLIGVFSLFPFLLFSQRENSKKHYKKGNYSKESFVYIKPFYGPPKIVYITKKAKDPPSWAPANGYKHRNIYFPQFKCYYDTYTGIYIYKSGIRWTRTFSPPELMIKEDLSSVKKVELDLDVDEPQVYFEQHSALYPPAP